MDLMQIRRGLLAQMGEKYLWKTIILEESHENDNIGNPTYWHDYLGIVDDDNYIYVCVFIGNNASNRSYRVDSIAFFAANCIASVRYDYTNISTGTATNRSLWASVGTKICCYKLPKT